MTAVWHARPGRTRLWRHARRVSAAVSATALAALIVISLPGQGARAAGRGFDQITGEGSTSSAVTVPWTSGLLNDSNKPISGTPAGELAPNTDRSSGHGPLSFMYDDFKNLKVTVSQTQDIAQQGLTVSWTGGEPTVIRSSEAEVNFLQLMECWGSNANGPDPEDCEFGSVPEPALILDRDIGTRSGLLCASGLAASTTNPPPAADGAGPIAGCDPEETGNQSHMAPCPGTSCDPSHTSFQVPFVPAPQPDGSPSTPAFGTQFSQYFDKTSTNEIQQAVTSQDGTGQVQFETLTATGAPGLGCGNPVNSRQVENCWLVIVPRGMYDPNGRRANLQVPSTAYLQSSPLSASNWANRIQVHLSYAPVAHFCPIGTQERETAGTQIITRAIDSWELALNRQADCTRVFGYSATAEPASTDDLCDPSSSTVGLAFTTIPVGSEAAREGTAPNCPQLPQILYAPVAVSAVGFGFNINNGTGYISTPVKMTPALMAKALTQVYRYDLPDVYPTVTTPGVDKGPPWVQTNPINMSADPQFTKLNPEIPPYLSSTFSVAPLLTLEASALNQQVWQWVQSDPGTDAWLDNGTKSAGNTVNADPYYQALKLGKAPAIDSFPRAYAPFLDLPPLNPLPPPVYSFTAAQHSPAVFTAQGSAYTAGQMVKLSDGSKPLPGGFTAGTIYFIVHPSGGTFQLAADKGGPGIASTSAGSGTVQLFAPPPPPPAGDSNHSMIDQTRHSLDLLPYVNNYSDAASRILTASNPTTGIWDDSAIPPDGVGEGWWDTNGIQPPGQTFIWGISDTPDLAADGLIDAGLCSASGNSCVTPSAASLTTALDSAKPDSAGLLEVNPAHPGNGGYPLVQVTYAAVATDQDSAALNDYADLIAYAAGAGQTAGAAPGDLPPGYLPLPQSLRNQARTVVAELHADAAHSGAASPLPGSGVPAGPPGPGTPAPASSPAPDFAVGKPSAVLASFSTAGQALGIIRWALLAVVVLGAGCASSGTVLRAVRVRRLLNLVRSFAKALRPVRLRRKPPGTVRT